MLKKIIRINGLLLLTISFFWSTVLFAQTNRELDSLINLLNTKGLTNEKETNLMYNVAKAYLHIDGKKSFAYADTTILLAEKTGNNKIKSEALSLQGVVYKDRGEFQNASEKHLLALKIKEANSDTMGVAICYNDIGVLYKVMKNYTKALQCYKRSNVLCRQINLGKGTAQTYNNIGTIFSELGNKDSAIVYYKRALSIAEKIKSNSAISTACNNIGEYYGNQNDNKKALIYFKKCLKIDLEEKNVYGMIMSYINIGGVCTQSKKYGEALNNYCIAEKLCLDNDEKPMLKNLYWSMSQSHADNNDKSKAYDYLLKYKNLYETLQTDEISKSIVDVETKYQTEKKDLEIARNKAEMRTKEEQAYIKNIIIGAIIVISVLLMTVAFILYRGEQVKQKSWLVSEMAAQKEIRSKAIIEAEEKERVRIAKDLHDGIGQLLSAAKMNLSSIESIIEIKGIEQQSAFKNAIDLLDESVREVRAVSHAMIPNTLLKLGLASAVREFITKIQNIPNLKVNLEIVGMNERLGQEKESILYRVIQEIISNIIKHAKASELTMQLIRHDNELSVIIEDNGVGFDITKINDFEGIGLKNIISRVEFINGKVHFDSTPGRGTIIIIEAPLI